MAADKTFSVSVDISNRIKEVVESEHLTFEDRVFTQLDESKCTRSERALSHLPQRLCAVRDLLASTPVMWVDRFCVFSPCAEVMINIVGLDIKPCIWICVQRSIASFVVDR